jgi:hypothetical protein
MKRRCYDPNNNRYYRYGGRGIKVCDRWKDSSDNFLEDMGERPSRQYSIERVDNNKDYEPSNCHWATNKEQANNRSDNKLIEFNGITQTQAQWADQLGVKQTLLYKRFKRGWSISRTLTTPNLYVNQVRELVPEEFMAIWNREDTVADVMKETNLNYWSVINQARRLRAKGFKVKRHGTRL